MNINSETSQYQTKLALLLLLGMVGVISTALFFEHQLGFIPCKLCLGQREPYYTAIPLGLIATLSAWRKWPACLTRGLLAICGLLMLYGLFLAVQHSGIEWGWWEGPTDCGVVEGGEINSTGDLLSQLVTKKPPSCNEAAGRFLGLSFAGWNVIASVVLAAIAFKAAVTEKS